jgi:hypothetical protein
MVAMDIVRVPSLTREILTQTHDYERHGTTTLFAGLNILGEHVIERCQSRHTDMSSSRSWTRLSSRRRDARTSISFSTTTARTTPHGESVAHQSPVLSFPLHPDRGVLVEARRALLRRDHAQTLAPGYVPQRDGTGRRPFASTSANTTRIRPFIGPPLPRRFSTRSNVVKKRW